VKDLLQLQCSNGAVRYAHTVVAGSQHEPGIFAGWREGKGESVALAGSKGEGPDIARTNSRALAGNLTD